MIQDTFDPRLVFPHFYNNMVIRNVLAPLSRWTVSDPKNKMPVDARHMLDGCNPRCQHPEPVRGAWGHDEKVLVTLDELTEKLPTAINCAVWLTDAETTGCLVLDIEKTCPAPIRDRLLSIGALYAEVSLSGQGYHLVMPLPKSFYDYPIAAKKTALREAHGWWEVLQENHFVTFTRTPLPFELPPLDEQLWDEFWVYLAKESNQPKSTVTAVNVGKRPEEPWFESLSAELLLENSQSLSCKPSDFNNDHSHYEWVSAKKVYHRVRTYLLNPKNKNSDVDLKKVANDDEILVWLTYDLLKNILDYRPKHDQTRSGMPWLMYVVTNAVAQVRDVEVNGIRKDLSPEEIQNINNIIQERISHAARSDIVP